MKLIILGDTHFGMRGDSLEFHNYYKRFYQEVFFPYIIENNITTIFQMGDLFDRRKFINFNTLYLSRQYFFDKIKELGLEFHTILGNHDIYYKNVLEVNSSQMLLNNYENITVYDEPNKITFDGVEVDVIPWICSDNEERIKKFIETSTSQICFGHFEIAGFEMDKGNVCHEGLDKKLLNRYDVVLSGHFHHKSSDGQITYVGTPGEMTWADYFDPRGFHTFDTDTRELEFIQNPYRMFHKLSYDDTTSDFEFWKSFDYSVLKETYVKVIVVNKQNPYLFDNVIDNLYKAGVSDISIVEDFTETLIENDDELINQAEDTMTILGKYIDNLTLNVDNDKLKALMKEVYVEALTTETE